MHDDRAPERPAHPRLDGIVDVYIHANPDLLPRRSDDVGLAEEANATGLSAIVHRHHYSSTAERSALARDATGFPILGAIMLNDSVGGINPSAVDLALQMGAVWVGMPTLSARFLRTNPWGKSGPGYPKAAMEFGPGDLCVLDDDGELTPETTDVLRLVADAGVALSLGYMSFAECAAVARAAADLGCDKLVLTNPTTAMRLSDAELDELLTIPGVYVELTSYPIHPEGPGGAGAAEPGIRRNVELIRHVGVDRAVVCSDGGKIDAPPPPRILEWALTAYADAGIGPDEIDTLVRVNPRRLVPSAPAH